MARKRYTITDGDRWFACRWIEKKLKNPSWLGEHRTYKASRGFELINESSIHHPTESLNRWCESWLRSQEWEQLKNAIRASRRRAHNPDSKTVTLSRNAWLLLNYVATKEMCTLSEAIERHLTRNTTNDA